MKEQHLNLATTLIRTANMPNEIRFNWTVRSIKSKVKLLSDFMRAMIVFYKNVPRWRQVGTQFEPST